MKLFAFIAALFGAILYLIDRWIARQIEQAIRGFAS